MQVLSPEHNQDLVRKHSASVEFEEEYRKRKLEKLRHLCFDVVRVSVCV